MSKEEVFELIQKKIQELDKPLEVDPRIEFCQEWADEHKYITIDDFSKLDIYELIDYLLPIVLDCKDIETTNHISQLFLNFFYYCSTEEMIEFANVAVDILASNEIDKVICMLDAPCEEEADRIAETIVNIEKDFIADLRKKEGYELEDEASSDFAMLLHVLKNHEDQFFDILALIAAHKCVRDRYQEVDSMLDRHKDSLSSKERRKYAEKYKKKLFKLDHALSVANSVSSFINQKRLEEKKNARSLEIKREKLVSLERTLKVALEKEEITNVSNIVNGIDYPDLAIAVLKLISEHNKPYYESLEKEYNELSSNNETHYRALLHDYGIKSKNYDISKIMHLKLDDIRSILDIIIRKFSFNDDKALKILEISDLERVELISKYIANGYVSIDYISDNIDLYDLNSSDIEILGENIGLLNSFNVNPYMFKNSMDVLFSNSKKLNDSLLILKEYDLIRYFKTTDNFSFLLRDNLCEVIDKYLEYGYEELLKEDLNILNLVNIKRLDIIHMLNIPIDSTDELYDILESKKFFINDKDIDSYLYNASCFHEKVDFDYSSDYLLEYIDGKRCYNFNGVLVSLPKVKRLLLSGKSLYDSIFSEMVVSEDEYNRVVDCLRQDVK